MAKITTWPYRRAEKHRLSGGGWQLRLPSGDVPLAEDLPSWDATADLRMVRKVYLDTSGVWTDCGLPVGTPLCVTACWEASGTKLRGTGTRTVVSTPNERTEVRLGVALKGAEIGGKIRVSVAVTLGATIEQRPIRAFRAGTLLCEDVIDVQIEGGGSRFPMEEISFQAAGPQFPKGAAWRLDWQQPDDLELPVLGSIRLFLNKDHPAMKGLVEDHLASGRLVMPFEDLAYTDGSAFCIVYPRKPEVRRQVATFRDWIVQQAGHALPALEH
jgi:hypothetical protein